MKKLLIYTLLFCFSCSFFLTPTVWAQENSIDPPQAYQPIEIEAKLKPYQAQPDLSDLNNLDRFQGFSSEQLAAIAENGFLVLPQNPDEGVGFQLHYLYEQNQYQRIPNFITVDSALHIFHVFFDHALRMVEEYNLLADLEQMTSVALDKAEAIYAEAESEQLKSEYGRVLLYYAVPYTLITGQAAALPDNLVASYQAELDKIAAAETYAENSLTGKDLNYMQFKPRGHYAGQENLENYFRAMMWYGILGLPLEQDEGGLDFSNTSFSLAASWLILSDEDQGLAELWHRINRVTAIFAGNSDDINLADMEQLIKKIYGENPDFADFYNDAYESQLAEAVAELPEPGIQAKLIMYTLDEGPEVPTGKQFRLMGQRFTLDALALQELMEPLIRPVPTVLDVAAVAGSEAAVDLVKTDYLNKMEEDEYLKRLENLQAGREDLDLAYWQSNLYNGWLWVLQGIIDFESVDKTGYPSFMQSDAYTYKNLNAAAGNFTELKHDTVLYSKQPMAEMGGAMPPQYDYYSYVEPQVEVYNRLAWLLQYAYAQLADYNLLEGNWEIQNAVNSLLSTFQFFSDISIKELAGQVITDEENFRLCQIGGAFENTIRNITNENMLPTQSPAVIADIAQIADINSALEVATGYPDVIYVVLQRPDNGELYLARGPVYSFYEFLEEGPPLSDQDWRGKLGLEEAKNEFTSYYKLEPENYNRDVPDQPQWVEEFKDIQGSKVTITPLEY